MNTDECLARARRALSASHESLETFVEGEAKTDDCMRQSSEALALSYRVLLGRERRDLARTSTDDDGVPHVD
jgi:hypothetical protein